MSRRSESSALSAGVTASVSLGGTDAGAFDQRELKLPPIAADTPVEFRALLGEIRKAAGNRSFGQIAVERPMARSTAFALTDTKRQGLPKRDLVVRFITACGLSKQRVGEVTGLWNVLDSKHAEAADSVEEAIAKLFQSRLRPRSCRSAKRWRRCCRSRAGWGVKTPPPPRS